MSGFKWEYVTCRKGDDGRFRLYDERGERFTPTRFYAFESETQAEEFLKSEDIRATIR